MFDIDYGKLKEWKININLFCLVEKKKDKMKILFMFFTNNFLINKNSYFSSIYK